MRANQSSTASEMCIISEPFTTPIPICVDSFLRGEIPAPPGRCRMRSGTKAVHDVGLLHDARNLKCAIEHYCDLLSMPNVFNPEHRHYAEELRLLSTRRGALIEHLMQLLWQEGVDVLAEDVNSNAAGASYFWGAGERIAGAYAVGSLVRPAKPVSLRRPAAASMERRGIGNKFGEVSFPDCHSGTVPLRTGTQTGLCGLIGASPEMVKVYHLISKVASSTHPVLISGESGTGKELVAHAIHRNGTNAAKPFVTVDCGSLVPTLIESELFGHVRGAFTGANQSKKGLFSAANGGTIFLDEIGELPLDLQAKLLRALQEKEVRPVGAIHPVPISVRVLAATNRDLRAMVAQGTFRKDLYFRLSVVDLKLPPLHKRQGDIAVLAAHFLERIHSETGTLHVFSEDAIRLMTEYDWPGNVRELENAIERACSLSSGPELHMIDLPTQLQEFHEHRRETDLMAANDAGVVLKDGPTVPSNAIAPIAEIERHAILSTIHHLNGDKLMAAKLLGIGKTTLYRKLKEYGLAETGDTTGD